MYRMYRQFGFGSPGGKLVILGTVLLALGLVLLLVKLIIFLAWYAAGIIALAGLILLAIGWLLSSKRKEDDEIEDGIHYF